MSTLSVIGTFHRRPWAIPEVAAALRRQTRLPDNLWLMFEEPDDGEALFDEGDWGIDDLDVQIVPMGFGVKPGVNPLGFACNLALDIDYGSDYFVYLTDDSLPDPRKFEVMARALDENPEWGAVYCSQDYGFADSPEDWLAGGRPHGVRHADGPQPDPYGRVDHTQVMHRRCEARWPLDRGDAALSDAHFFRALVAEKGPLMPVPEVLDWTRQLPDGLSVRR